MGTRFIATPESGVVEGHRAMIPRAGIESIVTSAAMNGVPANWIAESLREVGLPEAQWTGGRTEMPAGVRPWRDTYSAGQSVGLIDAVEPVAELAKRLAGEFAALVPGEEWRRRLAEVEAGWGVG